jgi:hypothetical protein
MTASNLRNRAAQFSSRASAFSFANHSAKSHVVMLGDNGKFWVLSFADAVKLEKLGYEVAA